MNKLGVKWQVELKTQQLPISYTLTFAHETDIFDLDNFYLTLRSNTLP